MNTPPENFGSHTIKLGDDWTVPNPDGLSRRTIVKGAAWTVPTIAIAAAAPSAAASTSDPCLDIPLDLEAVSMAWDDTAGGANAIGTYNGAHVYGGDAFLFTDFTMKNNGPQAVAGFQAAWSVETNTINPDLTSMVAFLPPSNTPIYPTTSYPPVQDPGAADRTTWVFDFYGLNVPAGATIVFRTAYRTAASTGGTYRPAAPYAIAQANSVDCNGNIYAAADLNHPDDTANNGGGVANGYYVLAP